jgi:hypothetical protein
VLDTPWSKIGSKVGYAIGFVVIQAVLIAFTSGIGNAIEEVGVALGKVGNALNKVSKGIGSVVTKVADFVKVLGEGITVIENGIMKVLEKLIEKVPFASSLLKPVGKLFEKLRNFLRKLFGVAEKEGVALVEGATKTALSAADEAPLLAPKATPPPPVNPNVTSPTKPKVTGSTGVSKPADASKTVTPFSRDARPAASEASKKLEQDLARQKPDAGKVSPLKPKGKPDPLPPAQSQRVPAQLAQEDAGKVAVGQSHGSGKGGTLQQGPGGKAANTQAARQGEPTVNAGGKSKPSGSTSSSTKGPSTSSKSSSAKGPSAPSKSAGTKTPPSTKKSAGSSGGSKQAGSSAGKTGTASSGTGTRRPKLPPPLKGLSNPKAPRPARIDFVKRNRDLLGPRQRADFDALKGKPKNNAQLRAWEERIDEGLRAQQSARVARSVGAKPGNVSTARRPKSGPRSGGYEWEETHAGLRGEPQNDFTHSVATDTDKAQFDSLGKPGGKVDPLENKAYDKPPTDFEPPRRPSFDSYDQILRNNRDAAKAAERFLAKEEDRLWKAHELADQMERQARIARDLKWPPVKWPMHSKAVDDYFTREVLPLVSRELRDHIRLVPEYFFD